MTTVAGNRSGAGYVEKEDEWRSEWNPDMLAPNMAESRLTPDLEAQLHRIHQAVNAGTLDKDAVNHALHTIHDMLTGVHYEAVDEEIEAGGEAPPVHAKRKKR